MRGGTAGADQLIGELSPFFFFFVRTVDADKRKRLPFLEEAWTFSQNELVLLSTGPPNTYFRLVFLSYSLLLRLILLCAGDSGSGL